EGWLAARTWRERAVLAAPAVAVWFVLPPAFGADLGYLHLFAGAALAAVLVLVAISLRPRVAWMLPLVLAGELVANGLGAQTSSARAIPDTPANQRALRPLYQ